MTDIQPDYTPFLGLVRPDLHDDVDATIDKIRDALDAIDTWAQVNSGGGFVDGPGFLWILDDPAFPSDAPGGIPTAASGSQLVGADGTDLQDIDGSTLTDDGLVIGDDFVLNRYGLDSLWFRTPGLYLVSVYSQGPPRPWYLHAQYTATVHWAAWQDSGNVRSDPGGQFSFSVGAIDVVQGPSGDPWVPGDPLGTGGSTLTVDAYQTSGAPSDVGAGLMIRRVL